MMKRNCNTFIYVWATVCCTLVVACFFGAYEAEEKTEVIGYVATMCMMLAAWGIGLFVSVKDDIRWSEEHPDDT